MATVNLSTSPTQIDDGTSVSVLVTNTGASDVELSRGGRLRPGQSRTVYPEGTALSAAALSGTGQVSTVATAAPTSQAAQVAANTAAIAGLPNTYGQDVRGFGGFNVKAASALLPFRAALAGRFSTPCNVVVMGDSTDEGTGVGTSSSLRNQAWPDQLARFLRARYPTTGEAGGAVTPNYIPIATDSSLTTGITLGGTWVTANNFGPSGYSKHSGSAGNTATYTIPAGVTSIDVLYVGGASITGWTYTIDGGSTSSTFTGGATTADGKTQRITGWDSATTHTLVITSVGTNTYIDGLLLYSGNESAGVRVFNVGHHGTKVAQYLNGGAYNWLTATPSATSLAGSQSLIPLNPDLLVVGWGYNDINTGITSATFQTQIATLVAGARAMLPTKTIPVVYLSKWTPGTSWLTGQIEPWANFAAAMNTLAAADTYGVALNLASTMPQPGGSLATALSLYSDTGVHAVAKGYQMAAETIGTFLVP